MEKSFQLNIILSDVNMERFNKVIAEQAEALVAFVPATDMVHKTDQDWIIHYN